MTTKLGTSRFVGSVALACALAAGCATTNTPASAGGSPTAADRDSVVRCFANSYRKRMGVGPVLDDKSDAAANELLAKYNGSAKRTCDAITASLGNATCGVATTLSAVVKCDRQTGRAQNDIDPATKAQVETSVREQGGGPSSAQRGF